MSRLARVFLDPAYAIALSAITDQYHVKAEALAAQMIRDRTSIVTTRAVMLEVGNALGKERFRAAGIALLDALERDPGVEIVPLDEELFARAFRLYRTRPDKEWGLIDCVSFVAMQDREIGAALTPDDHFVQAGFRALMREV